MACFEKEHGEKVMLINAFSEREHETIRVYRSFDEWLEDVDEDMRFWGRIVT